MTIMKRFVHEAPLQLAVEYRTACMMVSNENHEEGCQKTWLQLIVGLNKGFYYVWWWKHSMEVAYQQLQVKGGMFYNDERWGIVGGWCKKIMQVKGGISSLLWLAESLLWLAPSRRWRLWISIVYITNTPPPTPPVHHPLYTHTDLLCTL